EARIARELARAGVARWREARVRRPADRAAGAAVRRVRTHPGLAAVLGVRVAVREAVVAGDRARSARARGRGVRARGAGVAAPGRAADSGVVLGDAAPSARLL